MSRAAELAMRAARHYGVSPARLLDGSGREHDDVDRSGAGVDVCGGDRRGAGRDVVARRAGGAVGGVSAARQPLPPAGEIAGTLQGLLETHGHSAARVQTIGNGRIEVLWRHPAKWAGLNVTLSLTRPQAMALVQFLLVPLPPDEDPS